MHQKQNRKDADVVPPASLCNRIVQSGVGSNRRIKDEQHKSQPKDQNGTRRVQDLSAIIADRRKSPLNFFGGDTRS